ncbi:MAG: tetratricopeptide repeat protein [Desulfarculaceae bacterium]|nr:tetratricopeptide repeat protein [Desulfarculaceae bacterium]MCF8072290.1 tetratricopeptide repeat protein [Desulfarculaceae bacterium]MCF8100211.1 tetratricopeptide repeat protein [Desulfarculaceae bacterium]MCF8116216.1 tetratricopeptide repeat protein [Desulfarculaceae bacterium]
MTTSLKTTCPSVIQKALAAGLAWVLLAALAAAPALAQLVDEKNLDPRTRMNLLGMQGPIFKPMPEEYLRIGNSASIVGNHRYAIRMLNEAIDLGGLPMDKLSQAYTSRGISKSRSNQLTEAVRDFAKALEANPSNAPALYYLGETLRNLGLFTEAIVALNQAIALKPNYARAYYLRGTVWMIMGDNRLAADDFGMATNYDASISDAYYMRAMVLEKMGLLNKALASLKTFRVHNPLDKSITLLIKGLEQKIKKQGKAS